jgi:uroporphyrinogen-III synthase
MTAPAPPTTLIVVRPRAQADDWVAALRSQGVAARALPLIDILPAPEPARVAAAFAAIVAAADLAQGDEAAQPLVVFVSPNAVAGCFEALRGPSPALWPAGAWAGATGPGTVAALGEAGVEAARIVSPPPDDGRFDSEALWARVSSWAWRDRPVWIVRGNGGRDWLAHRLADEGARVAFVQSYARAAPSLDDAGQALLVNACAEPARWTWVFSSSEAIGHLQTLAPTVDWRAARALASHPRIAERAQALGFGRVDIVAPTVAAVVAAVQGDGGGMGLGPPA